MWGKILEKLVANRLQWQLVAGRLLSPNQFGFIPQKSTEDALTTAIKKIEEGLNSKDIVAVVSLDIRGAFDNAWWPSIIAQLNIKGIDPEVVRILCNYLKDRTVIMTYAGVTLERTTDRGCVQGSTCGPVLWDIQIDPVLRTVDAAEVHVQAFADDILVIGRAKTGLDLQHKINKALDQVYQWGKENKLQFAPSKTQAIIITKKYKYDSPTLQMGAPLSGLARASKCWV